MLRNEGQAIYASLIEVVRLELWVFPNEEDWKWASGAVRQIGVTEYTYYLYGRLSVVSRF
jgi:hypothetical protein